MAFILMALKDGRGDGSKSIGGHGEGDAGLLRLIYDTVSIATRWMYA